MAWQAFLLIILIFPKSLFGQPPPDLFNRQDFLGEKDKYKCINNITSSLDLISQTLKEISKSLEKEICSKPIKEPKNALSNWISSAKYIAGDTVVISCIEGYKTQTGDTRQAITCLHGDEWSRILSCHPTKVSRDCPPGFVALGEDCYFLELTTRMSWSNAILFCKTMGADLPIFKSANSFYKVKTFLEMIGSKAETIWVGATDQLQEGRWVWNTSHNAKLLAVPPGSFWGGSQPGGGTIENCAGLGKHDSYMMHDYPCSNNAFPMCHISLDTA